MRSEEFLQNDLRAGLQKSVVVVSTSDVSPALQIKGVEAAMSLAEYFRDKGKDVLVLVDSITRLAMAQRQIGLAAGEPPTSRISTFSIYNVTQISRTWWTREGEDHYDSKYGVG